MADKRLADAHRALYRMITDGQPPSDGTLARAAERWRIAEAVTSSRRWRVLNRAVQRYRRGDFR